MFEQLAGAVVGGLLSKKGGSQQQVASNEPWAPVQPWLKSLVSQGQSLSDYYQQNPLSQGQQRAYDNLGAQADYTRMLIPGLLGQLSAQPLGFDRSNPSARPQAFQFGGTGGAGGAGGLLSLLSQQRPSAPSRAPMIPMSQAPAAPQYGPTDPWWTMVLDNQSGGTGA